MRTALARREKNDGHAVRGQRIEDRGQRVVCRCAALPGQKRGYAATSLPSSARGFTLIEIMIVITIIGVLAALIIPKVIGRPDEARIIAAKQDIAQISQALKLYRLDNLRYPTTEQGLQALVKNPSIAPLPPNWKGNGYLERLPNDPWQHPYQYLQPGLHGEFDVMSLGADGAPGGEGNDADIGSWAL